MDTSELSWKIATEPSLYWRLAPNPFSPHALQLVAERFPNSSVSDVVVAVILAEPEGRYDRNFLHLPEDKREEELNKQNDTAFLVKQDLERYFNKNAKDLEKLAKDDVYGKLFEVVFGNSDLKQIELLYSQKNRIDLKLLIVNYVESLQSGVDQHNFLLKMASAALCLLIIFSFTQKQVSSFRNPTPINQTLGVVTEERTPPAFLKIPSINVAASVEQVGLTPEGDMDVPKNVNNAGWYNLGPMPGELGSSVVAGHFNGTYGEEAVFANLNKLKEGDNVYIEDEGGNTIAFVVTGTKIYEPGFADDVFVRNDGIYLNLITCDGVWDESKESFSKRLVVFAKIVE
jgi:LPXTG-site transpeptidase (sortase) family protein